MNIIKIEVLKRKSLDEYDNKPSFHSELWTYCPVNNKNQIESMTVQGFGYRQQLYAVNSVGKKIQIRKIDDNHYWLGTNWNDEYKWHVPYVTIIAEPVTTNFQRYKSYIPQKEWDSAMATKPHGSCIFAYLGRECPSGISCFRNHIPKTIADPVTSEKPAVVISNCLDTWFRPKPK